MTRKIASLLMLLLLGAAGLVAAVRAAPEDAPPGAEPPAGQLLVASAAIQDPRFYHSVILLLHHDRKGALGIVINRPLGERPLAALLAAAGSKGDGKEPGKNDKEAAVEGSIKVYFGGPVQPQFGFVIHTPEYHRSETRTVTPALAMTATKDVLRDIGRHQGPAKYLFALGYSGWGAGQLEGEIARHDWFTVPAEPDLVFDAERGSVWQKALARRTREL